MRSVSVVVPNHNRDITKIKEALPTWVEFIEVNLGLERSKQRNIGIEQANGKYILYLDSDQIPSQGLIEECWNLGEMGFTAIYIPEVITTKGFFGYLRNWERQFYTATPIDCVRFIRKDACPFFDESMSGPEDADHDRRVKGLRTTTTNVVYHADNETFLSYLKKKAYYTKSMKKFDKKWPNDKCLNFWWRCFGVFFEKGKWKKVLQRPDLFICLMGLIALRGVIYITKR